MKSILQQVGDLFSSTVDLAGARWKLYKIRMAQQVAGKMSSFAVAFCMIFFMLTALLLVSVGAAYWIGDSTGSTRNGFFIVGGFYVFMGILIYIFRVSWIKKPMETRIIKKLVS